MSRILELARMETGQYCLLLEYIGYSFYELAAVTNIQNFSS